MLAKRVIIPTDDVSLVVGPRRHGLDGAGVVDGLGEAVPPHMAVDHQVFGSVAADDDLPVGADAPQLSHTASRDIDGHE